MITPLRVWLDEMPLDAISDSIWVVGIDEVQPTYDSQTESRIGEGTTFLSSVRKNVGVVIRFVIESANLAENVRTMSQIQKWCMGGCLKISTRPGLFLSARCVEYPAMTSLQQGEEFEITFAAYENPYWQSESPSVVNNTPADIFVEGTAENALCESEIKNAGNAVCNSLTISAGDTNFSFTGLGLEKDETLICSHDSKDYLTISIKGTDGTMRSAYGKRTPESDDELMIECGKRQRIDVTGDGTFDVLVKARGRWL